MDNLENQAEEIEETAETAESYTRREALGTIGKVVAASAIGLTVLSKQARAQSLNLDFVVATYRLWIQSLPPQYGYESQIYLYAGGNTAACYLYFMKDGQTIPTNTVASNGLSAKVYFPRSRFAEIRDFLRYEKPVRITVVASNGIATLATDEYESVGDHDV